MVTNATRWVRDRLATAPAIYGLIVFEVVVAATSDHEPNAAALLLLALVTLAVLYLAHAFAETVAAHGRHRLRAALRHGLLESAGMLYAAILPTLVLLVCALAGVAADEAGGWSLLGGLFVLGFLGYQATAERGQRLWVRILGGVLTAVVGLIIMLLDYAVH